MLISEDLTTLIFEYNNIVMHYRRKDLTLTDRLVTDHLFLQMAKEFSPLDVGGLKYPLLMMDRTTNSRVLHRPSLDKFF